MLTTLHLVLKLKWFRYASIPQGSADDRVCWVTDRPAILAKGPQLASIFIWGHFKQGGGYDRRLHGKDS